MTVMTAVPAALPVTVTTVPLTLTEATPGALDSAVIAPSPGRVTLMVPVFALSVRVREDLLRVRLPAALPMLQPTVRDEVEPSDH